MRRFLRYSAVAGVVIAVLALAALASVVLEQPVAAQTEPQEQVETDTNRVIHVSGRGEVSARPDMATIRVGVETEADTASEALDENNVSMSEVISTTLEAGIAEDDVQTQGIQLRPIYQEPGETGGTRTVSGYRARNIVQVTVRDLDLLGSLLDSVVEVGGNTIEGIQFGVSDQEALQAEAREMAMNDAIEKAEQLTSLAGAELGEVVTIMASDTVPPPRPFELEQEQAAAADAEVPIARGTQTIEVNVQVSWRIR